MKSSPSFILCAPLDSLRAMLKPIFWVRMSLYLAPLGFLLLLSWQSCGKIYWASNSMVQIDGVLTKHYFEPLTQNRSALRVEYAYTYNQQNYLGKNLTFCPLFVTNTNGFDRFREKFDALPRVGSKVLIWIDPENPNNSVVYRHMPRFAIPVLMVLFLFSFWSLRKLDQWLKTKWPNEWK